MTNKDYLKILDEINDYCQNKYQIKKLNQVFFEIDLPYYLPIQSNRIIHFQLDSASIASYHFKQVVNKEDNGLYKHHTKVAMVYSTSMKIASKESSLNKYFQNLIKQYNYFVDSYVIKTKDFNVVKINNNNLGIYSNCILRDRNQQVKELVFLFNSNPIELMDYSKDGNKKTISKDLLNTISYNSQFIKEQNPYLNVGLTTIDAVQLLKNNKFNLAIIVAQSGFELFINTTIKEIAKLNPEVKFNSDLSIASKIDSLNQILECDDFKVGNNLVDNYLKAAHFLDDITINNYQASFKDADTFLQAMELLKRLIVNQLVRFDKYKDFFLEYLSNI